MNKALDTGDNYGQKLMFVCGLVHVPTSKTDRPETCQKRNGKEWIVMEAVISNKKGDIGMDAKTNTPAATRGKGGSEPGQGG